jgi:hypothetical protein
VELVGILKQTPPDRHSSDASRVLAKLSERTRAYGVHFSVTAVELSKRPVTLNLIEIIRVTHLTDAVQQVTEVMIHPQPDFQWLDVVKYLEL